jgi:2-keto-4-pentenoate hydratase/2-oxohepta-3-ene-1,7-dioic acid hydratase in catechol pathway
MKLATIKWGGEQRVALSSDAVTWRVLARSGAKRSPDLLSLIADAAVDYMQLPVEAEIQSQEFNFLAPLKGIEKIICIGKNFADHAREMGGDVPQRPIVFSKFASALIGPHDQIVLPSNSQCVDFEAELVAIIGRPGKNISSAKALTHVLGYCVGNDITARDWQKNCPGGQWLLGKTFDSFAPIGPYVTTADEVGDPIELDVRLRLNGQVMQESNTRNWIHTLDALISYLSQVVTLNPGDLIFTGTPAGVGAGRTPPLFLRPGDRVETEIDGLGRLENSVVAEFAAST